MYHSAERHRSAFSSRMTRRRMFMLHPVTRPARASEGGVKMVQPIASHLSPLRLLLPALAALAMISPLAAQPYPSGMIRIVNGNAPGTPPDIVSNDLSES